MGRVGDRKFVRLWEAMGCVLLSSGWWLIQGIGSPGTLSRDSDCPDNGALSEISIVYTFSAVLTTSRRVIFTHSPATAPAASALSQVHLWGRRCILDHRPKTHERPIFVRFRRKLDTENRNLRLR
jgi:hypothetical protein